jgi:hypothetical protein
LSLSGGEPLKTASGLSEAATAVRQETVVTGGARLLYWVRFLMRCVLTSLLLTAAVSTPVAAAERTSWNRIQYVGGTIQIQTNPYDWNTTLTATPDLIVIVIAPAKIFTPQQTVRVKPGQVRSLSSGQTAWRRVGEVNGSQLPGSQLPVSRPSLFGLGRRHEFIGIVYEAEDGKPAALLLDSDFNVKILQFLKKITGKPVEDSP